MQGMQAAPRAAAGALDRLLRTFRLSGRGPAAVREEHAPPSCPALRDDPRPRARVGSRVSDRTSKVFLRSHPARLFIDEAQRLPECFLGGTAVRDRPGPWPGAVPADRLREPGAAADGLGVAGRPAGPPGAVPSARPSYGGGGSSPTVGSGGFSGAVQARRRAKRSSWLDGYVSTFLSGTCLCSVCGRRRHG